MTITLRRASIMTLALLLAVAVFATADRQADAVGNERTFLVTVENLTQNQLLTPAVTAAHPAGTRVFRPGMPASAGLQDLAENGGVPTLAAELAAAPGVTDVAVAGDAPIAPGESVTAVITTDRSARFVSVAAMLICTNDGFAAATLVPLPSGQAVSGQYGIAWDAGTEMNTEDYADLVPPCDGSGASGMTNPAIAEDGVVRPHNGITGVADLTVADHGWPKHVIKVTIEQVRLYDVTVENLTAGQPLTPAVFAAHDARTAIFRKNAAASAGLQSLAENGGVPDLAAELAGAPGFGTVAVIGDAPIGPAASTTSRVAVGLGQRRASLAAMLVCTNDGFAATRSIRLPLSGMTVTAMGIGWDAGTETNTEAYADLVPPCDGSGGSGASDPALAEGGTVQPHSGIAGGGDLVAATHGWTDPVVRVTITHVTP